LRGNREISRNFRIFRYVGESNRTGSMIRALLALTLRAAFGVRYGIHASAVRPNAMDGVNAENAGAVFFRPPWMA
jgi:hypothetical protein